MIKISLCIPSYNRSKSFYKVILDCQNQSVPPYEIIVQDDRSEENELKKIQNDVKKFKNITFNINKVNLGLAKNVNEVIKKAKGDYLAIINNDDRLSKYYIEEITKAITENSQYNIYTTNAIGTSVADKVVGDYRLYTKNTVIKKKKDIRALWNRDFYTFMTISGATIYKTNFIKKNLFVTEYGNESDLDNALHFLSQEDVFYIDKPIYYVVLHDDQESYKIRAHSERLEAYIRRCLIIYKKYARDFSFVPFYLQKTKSIYTIQLLLKYKYSLKQIMKLLDISSPLIVLGYLALLFPIALNIFIKKIYFKYYFKDYVRYFPTAIS